MVSKAATEFRKRMQHLLDEFFGGRQATMAEAVGVQQSTVSRWVRGEVVPLHALLRRIDRAAGQPIQEWLVSGKGSVPRLEHGVSGQLAKGLQYTLPVLDDPISALATEKMTDEAVLHRQVAPAHFREGRFVLRMWINSPELAIRQGDLMLVEPDREWFRSPFRWRNRLALVRLGKPEAISLAVVRPVVGCETDTGLVEATPFESLVPHERHARRGQHKSVRLNWADLLAVCIHLERDQLGLSSCSDQQMTPAEPGRKRRVPVN